MSNSEALSKPETIINNDNIFKKLINQSGNNNDTTCLDLALKNKEYVKKIVSVSGKKVEKVELSSNLLLETWDSIVKAAEAEKIAAAKMSRSIKNNTIFTDYFYRLKSN